MSDEVTSIPRSDYDGTGFGEVPDAPWSLAQVWLSEAIVEHRAGGHGPAWEPNCLDVATVDADGMPDVRPVLMKFFTPAGPGFISDSGSAKARQLAANDHLAAALHWPTMHRVVRLRGRAVPLEIDDLVGYWSTRPWGSQISAWASQQSSVVTGRGELEQRVAEFAAQWPESGDAGPVPMPPTFCGWRIEASVVQFWAGRPSRLHDRLEYRRVGDGDLATEGVWQRTWLQP